MNDCPQLSSILLRCIATGVLASLLVAVCSCGVIDALEGKPADESDAGFDVDLSDTDPVDPTENACGGEAELLLDGEVTDPGEECGPCEDGVVVCDGVDEIRCIASTAANECGGCEPLPGREGDPCGPCDEGTWQCDGDGGMECVGDGEHNDCGGCEKLEATPTTTCEAAEDVNGIWGCTGPESLRCVPPGENVCGGVGELEHEPGTSCGTCDKGVWACDGIDEVRCENADTGVNVCGGCEPLFGVLGDECGKCDGEWACDGENDVFCDQPALNACGGCNDLGTSNPGELCADNVVYICENPETLVCPDDHEQEDDEPVNACGGDEELDHLPGDSCGPCDDGIHICTTSNKTECIDSTELNDCGGCQPLESTPGDNCGPCELDTVICDGENATTCDGSTECPEIDFATLPAEDVTDTEATLRGEITALPLEDVVDHGFCYATEEAPDQSNGTCQSLGALDDPETFEHRADDLLPGRSYHARVYALVGGDMIYADEVTFTTDAPPPTPFEAAEGESVDYVEITWEADEAVDEYILYRDDEEIATVDASEERYVDEEATAGATPTAPADVTAGETSTESVTVSWSDAHSPPGPTHDYEVAAVYPDVTSDRSEEFTGYRAAYEITDYELNIDDGGWFSIGVTTEYEDDDAPPGQLIPGTPSASDGTYDSHVALEIPAPPQVETESVSYRVRAVNDAGQGTSSGDAEGHRDIDEDSFEYQWFYSDDGDSGPFDPLFSPPTEDGHTYEDDTAPEDGSIRHYYAVVDADGAEAADSAVVSGYRAADPQVVTSPASDVQQQEATLHGEIVELGAPTPDQHGFCYGTVDDPTHDSEAECTELGEVTSTGDFQQTLTDLSAGTTYSVRAYVGVDGEYAYGFVVDFVTAPEAPTDLTTTSNTDYVSLAWSGVEGADEYWIYRDGASVTSVSTTSHDDTGADEGQAPAAPSLTASSGTHTDRVELAWAEPSVADGSLHTYQVVAANDGGTSDPSAESDGQRLAYPITHYLVEIDSAPWQYVGDVLTEDDYDADKPSIDSGDADASVDQYVTHVELSSSGAEALPGSPSNYRVRAVNDTGEGDPSEQQQGHIGVGELNYQWQRTDVDDPDADYFDVEEECADESVCDDTTAPVSGEARYYRMELTADGVDEPVYTEPPEPGSRQEPYCGGDGTADDPWQICSAASLANIGKLPETYDDNFVVTDDIDMTPIDDYDSIGDSTTDGFTGHFNGQHHVIEHLTIDRPNWDRRAMFSRIGEDGSVENIVLEDVEVVGGSEVGGLAGDNRGVITDCHVSGVVEATSWNVGLVAGRNWFASLSDSSASGTVIGNDVSTGGLVGYSRDSTITNSFADVDAQGPDRVGGFIGNQWNGSITESYATGDVSGDHYVGGFIGRNYSDGTVTDSHASGDVSGDTDVGGFVGVQIEAYDDIPSINNSYSTGMVTANESAGGLVGTNEDGAVNSSYWDTETSGLSSSAGGTPLTTEEFADENNFDGWDFENRWMMGPDAAEDERPLLHWANTCENNQDCETGVCEEGVCQWSPPYITVWKTDYPGDTDDNQIELPLVSSGNYDFTVEWGDGEQDHITQYDQEEVVHTYEEPGTYTVEITGQIEGWSFGESFFDYQDAEKLVEISQWGPLQLGDERNYFTGAANLQITATDVLNLEGTTSLSSAFRECESLESIPSINDWDVSNITNMSNMFNGAESFNEDIGDWDVSNVTRTSRMFSDASSFNQDLDNWDVSSVTNMANMFRSASSFNGNIGSWDVSNVERMRRMFQHATSFNQDISGWDVSSVTSIDSMFWRASDFNQDIGNWDVSNVTSLSGMFGLAYDFNQDIGNWDVSNVEVMNSMFYRARSFNQDIGNWDVSNVTSMYRVFENASDFNQDISGWEVGSVTRMDQMFLDARSFDHDISGWDVSNVTDMSEMFAEANLFNHDISGWDTGQVTDMSEMFREAEAFDQDLGAWDVTNVTEMSGMFSNVTLSTTNYDGLLNGWASQAVESGVDFDGGNSQYSTDGEDARNTLTDDHNWDISDGGLAD